MFPGNLINGRSGKRESNRVFECRTIDFVLQHEYLCRFTNRVLVVLLAALLIWPAAAMQDCCCAKKLAVSNSRTNKSIAKATSSPSPCCATKARQSNRQNWSVTTAKSWAIVADQSTCNCHHRIDLMSATIPKSTSSLKNPNWDRVSWLRWSDRSALKPGHTSRSISKGAVRQRLPLDSPDELCVRHCRWIA